MADNDWISGYLEAILDTGATTIEDQRVEQPQPVSSAANPGVVGFNTTKYFIEEVVSSHDESDLHQTWMKATATRNSKERSARLENLCWRIWHLSRKKRQIESADAQRIARRSLEQEQGLKDTAEDLSEDLSESENPVAEHSVSEGASKNNELRKWNEAQHKDKCLYIVLISLHGLVRGENMELGRDSDTGGQVKYVVEFAKALAMMPEVYRVDLLTRQIAAAEIDWSYGEPTEMLTSGSYDCCGDEVGESSGAYIVRIPCGPKDKYLRKELLWPYIQEFVDGALVHILNMAKVLGEQITGGEPVWPHVIHGHYADAGDSAALLSGALNVPMVLTGHSLGRNKLEQLLKQGRQSKDDINATYKIMRRIEAEEFALDAAELVITSTRQEIDEQWGLYDGFDVKLEKVLRARAKRGVSCHGRHMPRMAVIPPGMDFSSVVQDASDVPESDTDSELGTGSPASPRTDPPIWSEVMKFFNNPHKPMILALARPDPKKNLTTLVKAFGECRALRELANMVIKKKFKTLIMGNRDDIDGMSSGSASMLTTILKLIDKYDLYGQVAYPKHHKQCEVPDIYRLAAKTKGVFINPALVEPFGLTLIEAAAHGLPMVATKNGGPVDIQKTLGSGLLADPHDENEIANALLKLLGDRTLWIECRRNGLKNIHLYSWPQHCRTYLSKVAVCKRRQAQWQSSYSNYSIEDESQDSLRDVQDISLQLSDDGESNSSSIDNADRVKQEIEKHRQQQQQQQHQQQHQQKVIGLEKLQYNKFPLLRRRKRIFVIAVDCYEGNGLVDVINEVFKAGGKSTVGYILSTALTGAETVVMLSNAGISVMEFDALVCSSGSVIYYPTLNNHQQQNQVQLVADNEYKNHLDYQWGSQGIRKAMARLTTPESPAVFQDDQRCNSHCLAYRVNTASNILKIEEYRRRLRMRGLRCHVIYCHNVTKLHVIPVLASRSQVLRYMYVRWGVEVGSVYVCVGESGDSDYEQLLSGMHKTIIMRGVVKKGEMEILHTSGSYTKDDVVPSQSPNIVTTKPDFSSEAILLALNKLASNV